MIKKENDMKLMNVIMLFGMLIALDVTVTLLVARANTANKQESGAFSA